ncbi:MAG TPA: plastocyanin/azurin family copper-binding protein [Candidatus Dormibacteraeota bacterium]
MSDPTLAPGGTCEVKFTKAGTYPNQCTIHPGMTGKLVVTGG